MTDNFSFFTFSVFFGCSFEEFSAAVLQSYGDLLQKGKAYIKLHDDICLEKYFQSGNRMRSSAIHMVDF